MSHSTAGSSASGVHWMHFIAECGIEYGCQIVTLFFLNPPDCLYTKKSWEIFQCYEKTLWVGEKVTRISGMQMRYTWIILAIGALKVENGGRKCCVSSLSPADVTMMRQCVALSCRRRASSLCFKSAKRQAKRRNLARIGNERGHITCILVHRKIDL